MGWATKDFAEERRRRKKLVTRERTARKRPAKMHPLTDAGVYAVAQGAVRVFTRETFWRRKRTVAGLFHRETKPPSHCLTLTPLGWLWWSLIRTVRDSASHGCMYVWAQLIKWPNICIAGPTTLPDSISQLTTHGTVILPT